MRMLSGAKAVSVSWLHVFDCLESKLPDGKIHLPRASSYACPVSGQCCNCNLAPAPHGLAPWDTYASSCQGPGRGGIEAMLRQKCLHGMVPDGSWAARYYTGLLNKLAPKGVVFSFLVFLMDACMSSTGSLDWSPRVSCILHDPEEASCFDS